MLKNSMLDEELDDRSLQALLIGCRLDLQTLRRDVEAKDGETDENELSLSERRLRRLIGRLETAAAVLDRRFESATAPPAAIPAGPKQAGPEAAWLFNREADLRIKNSLEIIAGLLEKQASRAQGEEARLALQAANTRIGAVARVHACLHDKEAANGKIELQEYLATLCKEVAEAFGADEKGISLRIDLQPLAVQPETARSIGIIVTELVTNAVRHAFPPTSREGQAGEVHVTGEITQLCYRLCVQDDGVGLPQQGSIPLAPRMGLLLVNALAAQVRAELLVEVARGTRYTLALPV
jgi:two-component sensor histidine kinase